MRGRASSQGAGSLVTAAFLQALPTSPRAPCTGLHSRLTPLPGETRPLPEGLPPKPPQLADGSSPLGNRYAHDGLSMGWGPGGGTSFILPPAPHSYLADSFHPGMNTKGISCVFSRHFGIIQSPGKSNIKSSESHGT